MNWDNFWSGVLGFVLAALVALAFSFMIWTLKVSNYDAGFQCGRYNVGCYDRWKPAEVKK